MTLELAFFSSRTRDKLSRALVLKLGSGHGVSEKVCYNN